MNAECREREPAIRVLTALRSSFVVRVARTRVLRVLVARASKRHPGLVTRISRLLREAGDSPDVSKFLDDLSARVTGLGALERIAAELERLGEFGKCLRVYSILLDQRPTDAGLWYRKGICSEKYGDASAAIQSFARAAEANPAVGKYHLALADCWAALGQLDAAVSALEHGISEMPRYPKLYLRLGRIHEREGAPTVQRTMAGLQLLPGGHWEAAIAVYNRGIVHAPSDARLRFRVGLAEFNRGRWTEARVALEEAVRLEPARARYWSLLGRVTAAEYTDRGGPTPFQLERTIGSYRAALNLRSSGERTHQRLLGVALRYDLYDVVAAHLAQRDGADVAPEARALVQAFEPDGLCDSPRDLEQIIARDAGESRHPHPDWWFVLHAMYLRRRQHVDAYRAKQAFARALLAAGWSSEGKSASFERARALAYLGEFDEAVTALPSTRSVQASSSPAAVLGRKLVGEFGLFKGEVEIHRELRTVFGQVNHPIAEKRFVDLIHGKDIVIVGPALPKEELGSLIDGADTVIRTKVLEGVDEAETSYVGTRTDIAYYGALSSGLVRHQLARLVHRGTLGMAVFRTSRFSSGADRIVKHGDLRYLPTEFSGILRAIPFGILRIICDILRYDPRSINVVHADLFTTRIAHRAGYDQDMAWAAEGGRLRAPLSLLAHDYRVDFELFSALVESGRVSVRQDVRRICQMGTHEYLRLLDRVRQA